MPFLSYVALAVTLIDCKKYYNRNPSGCAPYKSSIRTLVYLLIRPKLSFLALKTYSLFFRTTLNFVRGYAQITHKFLCILKTREKEKVQAMYYLYKPEGAIIRHLEGDLRLHLSACAERAQRVEA